jgi:DNA polymerase III epsilon subunit-like protein
VHWTEVPVHVVDFEGSLNTGVVEFGVVTLHGGAVTGLATRPCRARRPIPPGEVAVHGLADHELASCEPFEAEWPRFANLRETGILAAHFSATEQSLLRATWPCPRLSPDFLRPGQRMAEWGPWIDTGRLAAEALAVGASLRLEDVIGALGLESELSESAARLCPVARRRYHCAPFDALSSALALVRLAQDASGRPWSLARVLAMSTADPRRRDEHTQAELF